MEFVIQIFPNHFFTVRSLRQNSKLVTMCSNRIVFLMEYVTGIWEFDYIGIGIGLMWKYHHFAVLDWCDVNLFCWGLRFVMPSICIRSNYFTSIWWDFCLCVMLFFLLLSLNAEMTPESLNEISAHLISVDVLNARTSINYVAPVHNWI